MSQPKKDTWYQTVKPSTPILVQHSKPKIKPNLLPLPKEEDPLAKNKEEWVKMITPYQGDENIMSEELGLYLCSRPL